MSFLPISHTATSIATSVMAGCPSDDFPLAHHNTRTREERIPGPSLHDARSQETVELVPVDDYFFEPCTGNAIDVAGDTPGPSHNQHAEETCGDLWAAVDSGDQTREEEGQEYGQEGGGGGQEDDHNEQEQFPTTPTEENRSQEHGNTPPYVHQWEEFTRYDVRLVNLPEGMPAKTVGDLFLQEFGVWDYRIVSNEVRSLIGAIKEAECLIQPTPGVGHWSHAYLKERVLQFWFDRPSVEGLDGSHPVWLREVRRVDGLLAGVHGRTVGVSLTKVEVGSFLDHGQFVVRASFYRQGNPRDCDLQLRLDFGTRSVLIGVDNMFSLEFQAKEMHDFVVVDLGGESCCIYLTLKHPPRIFQVLSSRGPSFELDPDDKRRLNSIPGIPVDVFGMCHTYKLEVSSRQAQSNRMLSLNNVLAMLTAVGKEVYYAKIGRKQAQCPLPTLKEGIPDTTVHRSDWEVNQAWMCLCASPNFVRDRFTDDFFKEMDKYSAETVAMGLYGMCAYLEHNLFFEPMEAFKHGRTKGRKKGYETDLANPRENFLLPRLVITPTRLILFEPDIIQSNRVLRHWGSKCRFIRVAIRDENMTKLSSTQGKMSDVLDYIEKVLNMGLLMRDAAFKFLGASNSQVRDHGCWMIEGGGEDNGRKVREWIGELSGIRNVAKYLSRLGQGFSTSIQTVEVDVPDYCLIPDIERNGFCFTDGIGKMTPQLAEKIARRLKLFYTPSALQIRFGGAKGVLAVDPNPNLEKIHPGKSVFVRPSMLKYDSQHTTVEVLQSKSYPQVLYLNQQLIMLLNNLGVPDSVFLNLLKDTLNDLSKMFIDEEVAGRKLKNVNCGIDWEALKSARFDVTSEPYIRSMLMALYRSQMNDIREKSRIPVNPTKARMLLGVVDETGTLEYGQVFIRISKDVNNVMSDAIVLAHDVVCGKSPCLHPGDVRVFRAVDCPHLHHMRDCIVFPSTGFRPHPNEMSGSDLDGDMYHVLWDPKLMPRRPNFRPMQYPSNKDRLVKGDITVGMMINFLRQSIEHDILGQIDNTHKAIADLHGLNTEHCLELAELHSKAVDAPKTGRWCHIPNKIRKEIKAYPDFMMKQDKPSYPSEKVLGSMFRECTKYLNACSISLSPNGSSDLNIDRLFKVDGYECFKEEAVKLMEEYNGKLAGLLRMYGIQTEGEFMSGYIEKFHQKLGREKASIQDITHRVRWNLIRKYRSAFFQDPNLYSDGKINEEVACQKASAWYYVTYCVKRDAEDYWVGGSCVRFLSFPWVVSDYLMKVYNRNLQQGQGQSISVTMKIGKSISDFFKSADHQLIWCFAERCRLRDWLAHALSECGKSYYPYLYGLSAALLFDERTPDTDILIWTDDSQYADKLTDDLNYQKKALYDIKDIIQGECRLCKVIRTPTLCRLMFKYSKWRGMITLVPGYLVQSFLLLEYIYIFPWLLPLLRVVVRWAQATGIIGTDVNSLLDPSVVCYMVISFCLKGNVASPVDAEQVQQRVDNDELLDSWLSTELWTEVIGRIYGECQGMPSLGKLLLYFFKMGPTQLDEPVHSSLTTVLRGEYYEEFAPVDGLKMIKDEMMRAYHRLSVHCDVASLLQKVEREEIIFLELYACHSMLDSEQYYARYMTRQTKADVEVHRRVKDRTPGLLFKVTSTNAGISTAKRQIDYFRRRGRALNYVNDHFPGPRELYVAHACSMIIEGFTSRNDRARLDDYINTRFPEDDNMGLYVMGLSHTESGPNPQLSDAQGKEFTLFKHHFRRQFRHLLDKTRYNVFLNGAWSLEVKFGRIYLSHPPKEFLEASDGVPVKSMLDTIVQDRSDQVLSNPLFWRHAVRQGGTPHSRGKKAGSWRDQADSKMRSAFFARIPPSISKDRLIQCLEGLGLQAVSTSEQYSLDCFGEDCGKIGVYGKDLNLLCVQNPCVKWMVVDVKRDRREGKEMDTRFQISSRVETKPQAYIKELRDFRHALIRTSRFVKVKHHMIARTREFRHVHRQDFVKVGDAPGLWKHTTVQVIECESKSRPRMAEKAFSDLDFTERCVEMQLVVDLTHIQNEQELTDDLIAELWKLGWRLSDKLSGMVMQQF